MLLDFNGENRDRESALRSVTKFRFLTEMGVEAVDWINLALGESALANSVNTIKFHTL
jgi:hypothetical protein